ncbi:bifunctional epoxide hydrolase 2-like isoform X2 [Mangifera indica]|uniref:bifunctional epoxide hydrolase 2-like isoform X2 n=1 Tax=Mangifera indica TaxID=29780 RepID=UPI001CFB0F84|nr:bifunctional epoxide hydrolase 2-like isoform X2 [Mangifera indica]
MDQIQHKYIHIRGVKLHVAELGTGPRVVVFIHGFPEAWYSWRHQIAALAAAGYRTIAPDLRGYGLSEPHPQPENASFNDFVEDTLAILDYLQIDKAFLVGKDFGSWPAYLLSILHPKRVSGIVSLGVPFFVPRPNRYQGLPEGFYIFRWKEPRRAEADFGRFDVKTVWQRIYILFSSSEIPIADQNKEIMDMVDPSSPPPPWLTIEDLANYAILYQKSGFHSPMQVPYFNLNNPKVEVPVLLIMGGKDYFLKFPGIEDYITTGEVNKYVDNLEIKFVADGNHFIQEQLPDKVNKFIVAFLNCESNQD